MPARPHHTRLFGLAARSGVSLSRRIRFRGSRGRLGVSLSRRALVVATIAALAMHVPATAPEIHAAPCTPTKFIVALNQSGQIDGDARTFFKASAANNSNTVCTGWSGSLTFSSNDPIMEWDQWSTNPAQASGGVAFTSLVPHTRGNITVTASSGSLTGSATFPVGDTTITLAFPATVQAGVATNMTVSARSAWTGLAAPYFYSTLAVHTGDAAAEWYETFPSLDPDLPRWDGTSAAGNLLTEIWHQSPSRGIVTFKTIFYAPGTKSIWAYDHYRPANASPSQSLVVLPTTLVVTPPASALVAQDTSVRVQARDSSDQPLTGFEAQIRLTTTDAGALINAPNPYRFLAGDNGAHSYAVRFNTLGTQTMTATGTRYPSLTGSSSTVVGTASFTLSVAPWYAGGSAIRAGEPAEVIVTAGTPNEPLTSFRGTIELSASDPGAIFEGLNEQGQYAFTAADAGVHVFRVRFASAGTQSVTATDIDNSGVLGSHSTSVAETYLAIESYPASQPGKTELAFVVCATKTSGSCSANDKLHDYEGTIGITSSDPNIVKGPGLASDGTYTFTGRGSQYATGIDDPSADHSRQSFHPSHLAPGTYTITFSDVRQLTRAATATVTITTAPTTASGYKLTVVPGEIEVSEAASTQLRVMAAAASTSCTLNALTSTDGISYCPRNVPLTAAATHPTSGNPVLHSSGNSIVAGNVAGPVSITSTQPAGQKTAIPTSIWVDGVQVGTLAIGSTTNTATKTQTLPGIPTTGIHTVRVLATGGIANPLQLTTLAYIPTAAYGYTGYTGTARLQSVPAGASFTGAPSGTYHFTGAGPGADNGRHTFPTTFSAAGDYHVDAVDTVNATIKSQPAPIAVMDAPPSGTILINEDAPYAASPSVALTLTAQGGALNQMRFSNDGVSWSAWEAAATSKEWSLTSGDGLKTVSYQLKGVDGQMSAIASDTIVLDTGAPVVPDVTADGSGVIQPVTNGPVYFGPPSGSITVSATSTAGPSGLAAIRFTNLTSDAGFEPTPILPNDVLLAPYEQVLDFSFPATAATIEVVAINGAGVESAPRVLDLVPDVEPPVASFSSPAAGPLSSNTVTIDWSESDDESGVVRRSMQRQRAPTTSGYCAVVRWSNNGPPRTNASPLIDTLDEGYCYRWVLTLEDAVGNVSTTATSAVLVDVSAPVVGFETPPENETLSLGVSGLDVTWTESTGSGSPITSRSLQQQRAPAAGGCPASGWVDDGPPVATASPFVSAGLALGNCYRWILTAQDAAGNVTIAQSGSVRLERMLLASPAPGATIFATEPVVVDVVAGVAVSRVDFRIDGSVFLTDDTAPFEAALDTTELNDGDHIITADVVEDGGPTTPLTVTVAVSNVLTADERLDVDFAAGRLSVDEYSVNGVYALGAAFHVPARYQSTTPPGGGVGGIARFLEHWDELSQDARDEITAFLAQPERGALYGAEELPGETGRFTTTQASTAGLDCVLVTNGGFFGNGDGTGTKCVRETDHFSITYIVDGQGSFAAETTSSTDERGDDPFDLTSCPDPCNGVPDYIDEVARGLEDAYDVYAGQLLQYRVWWSGKVPVRIDNTDGGQVLPNILRLDLFPNAQTIQIGHDLSSPFYLAHHELFHVFQYGHMNNATQWWMKVSKDPWWWMEATADWASGVVSRSGKLGDENSYALRLPHFLGRPNERLAAFDDDIKNAGRQYGAFVFAEYLAENLAHDDAGNRITDPSVIKQTWDRIAGQSGLQHVEPALIGVAQDHGTTLRDLLPDFALANYLLAYDDALPGGPPSDVESVWRTVLDDPTLITQHDDVGPARPRRERVDIVEGQIATDALFVHAGGSAYVDVVPPDSSGAGELRVAVSGAIDDRLHARVVTLRPGEPRVCVETPITIDGDGSGVVSVPIPDGCRYAVLIFTGVDIPGGTPIEFGWSATFVPAIFDSFDRTTAADGSQGLGNSTFGDHPWISFGDGLTYTDGSDAVFASSASDTFQVVKPWQWWEASESPPWASDHFVVETRFNISEMVDGATTLDGLGIDMFSNTWAHWRGVHLEFVDSPAQGGVTRHLEVNGATSSWPRARAEVPVGEFLAATDYILKWEVDIGTVMRAKVWRAGDPEPDWQVSIVDPGAATFAGVNSSIMVYSRMSPGIDQTKRFEYLDVRDLGP
jgi:hypothetical protein